MSDTPALHADVSRFTKALADVITVAAQSGDSISRLRDQMLALSTQMLAARNEHIARHHDQESPARSALHSAYDRRRRARRARGRR